MNANHPYPLKLDVDGSANPNNVVLFKRYRFTLLSDYLVRIEFSPVGTFIDDITQTVWHRRTPDVTFVKKASSGGLTIETSALRIVCSDGELLIADALKIFVKATKTTWQFGTESENLLGTARTLDGIDGKTKLSDGVVSRSGYAILDDSKSLLLDGYGWPKPRKGNGADLYFFGYGHRYLEAVNAYYMISGNAPLIPRYILGNWWSKYWAYTDEQLLGIVDRFRSEGIPLSVCIVDMDWHITAIAGVQDYWAGWTGYTVNKKYYPDLAGFIRKLHERGLKTSVNLHPAGGVKAYEETYPAMVAWMGVDPKSKETVPFDATSPQAMAGYFEILLHPYEDMGVDFWWIDWQQGTKTKMEGLDPLWMLNHLHYYDSARDPHKRPFTFSRWCANGAQRYPIGFSGDAIITWESLKYQPYFTATAANIGFGLWSHDIGGHFGGKEDPELYARWVEFGVFSPILRMHSTANDFIVREPWRHAPGIHAILTDYLRFRHQLVPYIYSAVRDDAISGRPLILPLYYAEPENDHAYSADGVYSFGTEMVVAPVTEPINNRTKRAETEFYLPHGLWTDLFTDEVHRGGKVIKLHRALEHQNAFVKQGGIVVLAQDDMEPAADNPGAFTVKVYPGVDNAFVLYEDDGMSPAYKNGDFHETRFSLRNEKSRLFFRIGPDKQPKPYLPGSRTYTIDFVNAAGVVATQPWQQKQNHLLVTTGPVTPYDTIEFVVELYEKNNGKIAALAQIERLLVDNILEPEVKRTVYQAFATGKNADAVEKGFKKVPPRLKAVLADVLAEFPF